MTGLSGSKGDEYSFWHRDISTLLWYLEKCQTLKPLGQLKYSFSKTDYVLSYTYDILVIYKKPNLCNSTAAALLHKMQERYYKDFSFHSLYIFLPPWLSALLVAFFLSPLIDHLTLMFSLLPVLNGLFLDLLPRVFDFKGVQQLIWAELHT